MTPGPLSHLDPALPPLEPSPASAERLDRLARRFPDAAPAFAELARRAPDPDLALAGVERYADAAAALPAEPDLREALVLLCGSSRLAARLLALHPGLLRRTARSPWLTRPRAEASLRRLLARAARGLAPGDGAGFDRLLRRVRAREVLRISLRDLRRAPMREVTAELSGLALACTDAAIRFHDRRLRTRHGPPAGLEAREPGAGFCALAMGKLGANELNFSSDVDLIYVYGQDGETADGTTHFAYFAKLAEAVTESMARPTEEGFVFRVDLNLRPDGRSGPIVNGVRAAELYYQSFGRSWERNALLKARPGAGDLAVGDELLGLLEGFVWRRSLDLGVLGEIQAMKARIDARAGAEGRDDLKLGKGGIREAEFFVSALQLVHGGRPGGERLRERAVLPAADRLLYAGVLQARDRDALADAYLFLRRAEHRVQMIEGAQVHRLPEGEERRLVARAMGFPSVAAFEEALGLHRDRVAALFAGLLGVESRPPLDPELALLADPQVEPERRSAIAAKRGLADPDRALAAIDALARRRTPFSPLGDPAQAVDLLAEALATPDPDQALSHLSEFAAALRSPEAYFRLLAEHRRVARLLLSLFGTSDFLSKRFLRHPELLDGLLREDQVSLVKSRAELAAEADERLALHGPDLQIDERVERRLGELRRLKNEEVLRVAIHDIAGTLRLADVAAQLTAVAEVCLERALSLAEEEAREKGRAAPGRLCVVAMGKLGGAELGYHSDLDLIFLYPEGEEEQHAGYARLAQRLMSFLQVPLREGVLYKIDTRLRPSGNQGALVTSASGFARYHTGKGGGEEPVRSQLWERQALIRARPVAGDVAAFERVRQTVLDEVVYGEPGDVGALAAEIRRMRERIEAEIGQERERGKNPKAGRGGLIDVEFAVQYLQLAHGHAFPELRVPSTPLALERLRAAGLLREGPHEALSRGYEFLRRLELRLRIVHDYTIDHLPRGGRALAQLARRLGYAGDDPGERLLADYGRVTERVRAAFDEVTR
ncbi:bifunctional [glutamate--ammonia ligase]-adenylyl-L-tyrosine phosphorylase/[glutamate--ammonia-ligase] adenylyltransferase [Anaeromyxobacter paludicola]|uniref:Glutamate-ammonia-ligase adenylyltransferase n=1 Tax=Anaeromyxobacter paludicola TaxID=2918171 RepID=A0ABM7X932_9BACT|nr:bifunctional [glutamate--ammonia ligase]-adenylyl-L-tyrosine phosphorylase/[glutamate--ammonia-ligase] adenylyltransferase [Anaeromyxobacter paludicola]BDG08361.1 glutamate-ammonia-ligase adenylyltransferase [Anaeromyxobacter paludicola]